MRLTDDRFAASEPTLGVEFGSRILSVGENGKRVKVQCECLEGATGADCVRGRGEESVLDNAGLSGIAVGGCAEAASAESPSRSRFLGIPITSS